MAYVLRRLLEMVPVLLIVVAATFFLAHAVPGGPFDKDRPLPAEVKARLEKYYGLDQPLPIQLGNYGTYHHKSIRKPCSKLLCKLLWILTPSSCNRFCRLSSLFNKVTKASV